MCPPSTHASIASTTTTSDLLPPGYIRALIPPTKFCRAAYMHAASLLHPTILAHSLRLYLYTKALAASTRSGYHRNDSNEDFLFTACLFHDLGTASIYNSSANRFEVDGADAAVAFLVENGHGDESEAGMRDEVWRAVALHTSKGIVERMGELPALMRRGLDAEFCVGKWRDEDGIEDVEGTKGKVEKQFPRGEIEKVLGDVVAAQAVERPEKAPGGSWPGDLLRAYREDPGWEGVNKGF